MKSFFHFLKLSLCTLLFASTLHAQQRGVFLDRTEYTGGLLTGAKQKNGDYINVDVTTPSKQGIVGFWFKRDLAADAESDEDPLRTDGFSNLMSFGFNNTLMSTTRVGSADLATQNAYDGAWHYIYVTFQIVDTTPPEGGTITADNTLNYYLDGAATPFKTLVAQGSGNLNMNIGAAISGIKFASEHNLIVDDISVWNSNSADILAMHRSIGTIGMQAFNSTHANLFKYFSFDGASPTPPEWHASDNTLFSNRGTVGTSFYNYGATTPVYVDTTGRRSQFIALNVISDYGATAVTPNTGLSSSAYNPDPTQTITFTAPEFVYLDRHGNEIGSSNSTNIASFLDKAVIRAKNVGYVVNGQRTDTGGNATRTFTQSRTDDLRIEWLWELEYAVSLGVNDSNLTSTTANLTFTGNGSQQSAGFGKFWVKAGTQVSATLDGVIDAGASVGTRYRLQEISVENNDTTAGADRYMSFDGVDDLLNMAGSAPLPDVTNFTTEFWMRWDGVSRANNARIMSLHTEVGGGNAVNVYSLWISGSGHATPNSLFFNSAVGGGLTIDSNYLDTAWHHWAFSYDQAAQEMKVYRDGELIQTKGSYNLNFDVNNTGNGSLLIGKHPGANDPFGGSLNNLRLWTTPLDAAAVNTAKDTQDYADATAGLEFEFTFDNDTVTTATGRGRTTYSAALNNYSATHFDNLTDAEKINVIYPSRERRNITIGDITEISTGNLIVDSWIGLNYTFQREYKLDLPVTSTGGNANALTSMPYAVVDGTDLYDTSIQAAWVPELSQVRVGSRYRYSLFPICETLSSVNTGLGSLAGFTSETMRDATSLDSKPAREITINALGGPGSVALNFDKTIYRAEISLGEFLDARDLTRLNAQLVPDLCVGASLNLTAGPNATPVDVVDANGEAQLSDSYVWDAVGKRIVPTAPGIITVEWPDVDGSTTHMIQFASHLPEVDITNLPYDRENATNEGYRLGSHPAYVTNVVMNSVNDSFPGSPRANYISLYNGNSSNDPIPVELDVNTADRWFFKKITYTDSLDIARTDSATSTAFQATGRGRAVALYQYRPDPNQVANGDTQREAYLARVIETKPHSDFQIDDQTLSSNDRKAIHFDGAAANYLTVEPVNNTSAAILKTGSPFTVEFWAKNDPANTSAEKRVIYEQANTAQDKLFQFGFNGPAHATAPSHFFLNGGQPAITENFDSGAIANSNLVVANGSTGQPTFSNSEVGFNGLGNENFIRTTTADITIDTVIEATSKLTVSPSQFGNLTPLAKIGMGLNGAFQPLAAFEVHPRDGQPIRVSTIINGVSSDITGGANIATANAKLRYHYSASAQTMTLEVHENYTSGAFVPTHTFGPIDTSAASLTSSNAFSFIGGSLTASFDNLLIDRANAISFASAPGNDWNHFAVTYAAPSANSKNLRVYANGQLLGESIYSVPMLATDVNTQVIGKSLIEAFSAAGSIDNFRIWDRELTAQEVRSVRRSANPTSPAVPVLNLTADTLPSSPSVAIGPASDRIDVPAGANIASMRVTPAEDTFSEVASRVLSKLDTAAFGSGYMLSGAQNYNAALYDRSQASGQWGPVFPVNWSGVFPSNANTELLWYANASRVVPSLDTTQTPDAVATLHPNIDFPATAMRIGSVDYPSQGKDKDARIYIASRQGTEGVDANGAQQLLIDPAKYDELTIYNQPSPSSIGYNPNEEHAILAPSIKATLENDNAFNLGQDAAFALQQDLNLTNRTGTYTSDPWTLIQYRDKATGERFMNAYKVEKERIPAPSYRFQYNFNAGDIVVQPYPLNRVVGNLIMQDDRGGNIAVNNIAQRTLWFDKNHTGWVVSGGGKFFYQFWYPFRDEFWYDFDKNGTNDITPGEPLAWVPSNGQFRNSGTTAQPQRVLFDSLWGNNYPKLKRGETLTFAGGENKAENPLDAGLPAVVGMASSELIYDSATPTMAYDRTTVNVNGIRINDPYTNASARVTRPLDRHEQSVALADMPTSLKPAATDNVMVVAERWYFKQLTGSLQKRFYYDSLNEKLVFRGRLNDKESGAPDLTDQPIALSIIEANNLTQTAYQSLRGLDTSSTWTAAIDAIYLSTQDPNGFAPTAAYPNPSTSAPVFYSGLADPPNGGSVNVPFYDAAGTQLVSGTGISVTPATSLGAGSALVPTSTLLTQNTSQKLYLTVAENNDASLTGAVALHIIEIAPERFRGAIKLVEAQDVFDDKVNLIHTGDFGGDTRDLYYEWWVRDVAELSTVGTPETDASWQLYTDGLNQRSISFSGRPDITLADKLFFCRYGEKNELLAVSGQTNSVTDNPDTANVTPASWRLLDINNPADNWNIPSGAAVPFQWAGAANSPQQQADGSKKYVPQLIMGWVKRVLDRVNPYEARYTDFYNNGSPATYSSQIQIAGGPFIGKVALNSDKNVIENVGLIQLYETVLARAKELTLNIPGVANDGTNQAVLLAATRLSFLYELLAQEAYSDAQNPLVPVSNDNGLADSASFIHAFQNQEADLLDEELALLRGTDFVKAYPSYNRLFWNYVKGTGEAAYNAVYSIQDSNTDGFINEFDAAKQYPQGHGDAWGHFLSANNMHYTLLGLSEFHWRARPELYALLDNVIEADYLDEKSLARISAAKARTGLEIVRATYREAYTANPEGQWQGYTDTVDPARAWGVSEWSKRTGQAAYFDWITANAVVPTTASAPLEGLAVIDRQTNLSELSEIAGSLLGIQNALDEANSGANPAGLDTDTITFDIDPVAFHGTGNGDRKSHFEQIYERAVSAGQNAITAHEYASAIEKQLRKLTDDTTQIQLETVRQDLDYRNRLIEIFGTPYDGQIGTGKPYPEGYEGPDNLMYLYVNRTDPNKLYPAAGSTRFTQVQGKLTAARTSYQNLDFNNFFFADVRDFSEGIGTIFNNSFLTATPTADTITFSAGVTIQTSDFAFTVPDVDSNGIPDWGNRRATGEVQILINELLQEELAFKQGLKSYEAYIREVDIRTQQLTALLESQYIKNESRKDAAAGQIAANAVAVAGQIGQSLAAWFGDFALLGGQASAEAFPTAVGTSNDATSVIRATALSVGIALKKAADTKLAVATVINELGKFTSQYIDLQLADTETRSAELMEIRALIAEVSSLLQQEETRRVALGTHLQQMHIKGALLKSKIAEGFRIMDEREAFNTSIAAETQRNRYSDMVRRLSRNEALSKYQNSYQNAMRYAWLAAKAYDYETSLDAGDPAAATTYFESILKERQLGQWSNGQPQVGNGGLAAILSTMKANFDVLEGQIGINNPQLETGLLSLRHEKFRIAREAEVSDAHWKNTLTEYSVKNLWDVPEFRRYCRPFASPSVGAQPGIVIDFTSEINSGRNFFGKELGAGDHAFSSANFTTKVSSLGIWFEGYNDSGLATAPRVYLVPVGSDVQRVANAQYPTARQWNVLEQAIPAPFAINQANLTNPNFIPNTESSNGSFADLRRFGDFRAYHTNGGSSVDSAQMVTNSRLIGRSVWNTRWLLVIPGATLHADANYGVEQFINNVDDIKIQFETYSHEGN